LFANINVLQNEEEEEDKERLSANQVNDILIKVAKQSYLS